MKILNLKEIGSSKGVANGGKVATIGGGHADFFRWICI